MRLTRPNVSRLQLPAGKSEIIVFDDALPGFGVRIRAGGKRTWVAQYRIGTKQRRVTLGNLEAVDPDEARKRAKDALAKVQLGADPQAEKQTARARVSLTLGKTVESYLENVAPQRQRPRSLVMTRRYLRTLWAPLHGLPLDGIKRATVAARLNELAKEHGPASANRARQTLSAFFSWAMGEGLTETNPVVGTNKATERGSRDRVLTDVELAAIWRACRDNDFGRIVRLLILTAQRRDEVGGLARSEVDFNNALWTLPVDRSKNGLQHQVPLSPPALSLLRACAGRDARDKLFGGSGAGYTGWSSAKIQLDRQLVATGACTTPWTLHDLRRTAATRMADLGVQPHVVEAVLNHVSGHKAGVAGIYNRATYAKEKREALNLWAAHLIDVLGAQ